MQFRIIGEQLAELIEVALDDGAIGRDQRRLVIVSVIGPLNVSYRLQK